MLLFSSDPVADFLELMLPDTYEVRAYFVAMGVGNFIICILMETFLTGNETVTAKIYQLKDRCCKSSG